MEYLGYIAGALTTYSFIPQVIKIIKTKSTKDISLLTFMIFTLGMFFWLLYGLYLKNTAMIITNSLTLVLASIVLFYKVKLDFAFKNDINKKD